MSRTVYHFIDKLENINEIDGNAWAGTTAGGGTASGNGNALDIHTIANGGFPTMDTNTFTACWTNCPAFSGGLKNGLQRYVGKPNRDVREPVSLVSRSANIWRSIGFLYGFVQDGVNGASIDVNGDVNQLSRSYDDICKDRLYYSGKANLSIGVTIPDSNFYNINYGDIDEDSTIIAIAPFLNPTTGKLQPTPYSRWSTNYTTSNGGTNDIVGVFFSVSVNRAYNGTGNIGLPYYRLRFGIIFSDGSFDYLRTRTYTDTTETTAERNAQIRNKKFFLFLDKLGNYRFCRKDVASGLLDMVVGNSSYTIPLEIFPDNNIGIGTQTTPFVFGLGQQSACGINTYLTQQKRFEINYEFS